MNQNNITDINFENEEEEKLAVMADRLSTMSNLKKILPSLNQHMEDLSLFLDQKEGVFSEQQKKEGIDILQELSERINAIQRLNKVLETQSEDVFISDLELCQEFITDTLTFSTQIVNFKEKN